jgi:iron complex outermembrane receptor protein
MFRSGHLLRSSVSWIGLTLLTAGAAVAQQVPAAQPADQSVEPPVDQTGVADDDDTDSVVVTARRRDEVLQNIPVSGTVVTEEEILDLGGFTSEADLGILFTGVEVDLDGNQEFFIRGAGTGVTPFTSSATTQFRNGAEVAGGFGGRGFERMDYFDSRQTEVYRGAQGALYGRNAVGGVVVINNNDPKPYREYRVTSQYDFDKDETRVDAVYNTPLIEDRLFLRLGAAYQDGEGFYRNDFYNGQAFDNPKFGGGRIGLKALISEALDATLIVDYGESVSDSIPGGIVTATVPGQYFTVTGAPVDLQGNPLPDLDPNVAGLQAGFPGPNPGSIYNQAFDTPGSYDEGSWTANLRVNWDLPFAVAQSITGYRQRDYDISFDADKGYLGGVLRALPALCGATAAARIAGPIPIAGRNAAQVGRNGLGQFVLTNGRAATAADLNATGNDPAGMCANSTDSRTNIFTQEIRLVSRDSGPLNWLLGADFRRFDNPVNQFQVGRNPVNTAAINTTTNVFNTLQARNLNLITRNYQENYGIYASVGYEVTDWFNLSGSIRYSNDLVKSSNETTDLDRIRGFVVATGANSVPIARGNVAGGSFILNDSYGDVIQFNYGSDRFESVVPSVAATFTLPNDDVFYMSFGQGYRAGGFNRISGTRVVNGVTETLPAAYEDENADAYEIGYKGGLRFERGRGFNYSASVFHTRYSNFIDTAPVVSGEIDPGDESGDVISDTVAFNLGDAYVQGVEVDGRLNWSGLLFEDDNFIWRGGLTYGMSKILSGPDKGRELNFVSTWTYNGTLTYRKPLDLGPIQGLFLSTNYYALVDTDNTGNARGRDIRRTVNARGGVEGEIGDQSWQLALFADNVLDVSYDVTRPAIHGVPGYSQNDPVSVGIRFSISGREGGERRRRNR